MFLTERNAMRLLNIRCSDLILIFLKFACDQIIESMEYFQFCYFQIFKFFHALRLLCGQNCETLSSVCSIVVTF